MNNTNMTISNPMLIAAMELVRKSNSPKNRKVFIDEMKHAKFLSPVIITPTPVPNENGLVKLSADSKVHVPMLSAPDGKKFFMAFTDPSEMQKAKTEKKLHVFGFEFKDYVQMVKKAEEGCHGVVINPYGSSMVINIDMIKSITEEAKEEQTETEAKAADEAAEQTASQEN